jgi:hypothetical protein
MARKQRKELRVDRFITSLRVEEGEWVREHASALDMSLSATIRRAVRAYRESLAEEASPSKQRALVSLR